MSQEQYDFNENLRWLEAEQTMYFGYNEDEVDTMVAYYQEKEQLEYDTVCIDTLCTK